MAKAFGKRPVDWLKTKAAKEFTGALSRVKNIVLTDLVKVVNGGNNNGTWFHKDVAIEFARWLAPEFGIWCNDVIQELIKKRFFDSDYIRTSIPLRQRNFLGLNV